MRVGLPRRALANVRSITRQTLPSILLVVLAAVVLVPSILTYRRVPGGDSGVFLYAGWQILDGQIPYLDVWDHKPPGILYIDALGLLIGGGSRLGP